MDARKKIYLIVLLCLIFPLVSANTITLLTPEDDDACYTNTTVTFRYDVNITADNGTIYNLSHADLYHNNTGTWGVEQTNFSITNGTLNLFRDSIDAGTIIWNVKVFNSSSSGLFAPANFTVTVVDAPYCAVLSGFAHNSEPPLGGFGTVTATLKNTKGVALAGQDCHVYVTNASGTMIRDYPTMAAQAETQVFLDEGGNWINIAESPLTDDNGVYTYEYEIDRSHYYYNDTYTVYLNCNGQQESGSFTVALPRTFWGRFTSLNYDLAETQVFFKSNMGWLILWVISILLVASVAGLVRRRWRSR